MFFENRHHAGKLLAEALNKYKNQPNTIVIGLPRGGVVTAFEIATYLNLPLDVICPRKVGAPYNPELALGAVTETGEGFFNEELISMLDVPESYLKQEIEKEKKTAAYRLNLFRKNKPPINFENKTVIIADDGLATGATMKAAIQAVRAQNPAKIVAAVPVAPLHTLEEVSAMADEVTCLSTPAHFMAVGEFYDDFTATEDDEVVQLLQHSAKH